MNGGDLLARIMREHGVGTAFGVVSVHNLPLVEAVDRDLEFVPVRHEAAAVNAADGYARSTGGLGVAITSTGTGAGNAAGALIEAQTARSRVLHVTGQIDARYLGQGRGVIHETRDQLGMLRAVSRYAETVHSPEAAAGILHQAALRAATAPFGPASVEWPIDLQYVPHDDPYSTGVVQALPEIDDAEVAEVARLITNARRPLIWAGGGATGAGAEISELAELLGAGILTSNAGRGTVPEDDELVLGNFASNPRMRPLLAESDLLIAVGTHFRSNETKHYQLELPEHCVQIDVDREAIGRSYPAAAGIVGEARRALAALLARLGEPGTEEGWPARVRATRSAVRDHLAAAIGPYLPICQAIRENLPREAVIARDVTIPVSQWGNRLLPIYHPTTNLFPLGGGIGQGLAMGIGAAVANPAQPTVALVGDGGLAVHLGELATLAQQRPWLVVVLFNDGGYGVLRNMQDAHSSHRAGVDLYTPDFGKLASSLALPYQLVSSPERFAEVFGKAIADHGPSIVEVDVTALPEPPEPFVPPVATPAR
ncbi:acetolactate synthase-1/2/3 large subunit [Tamaricihabitans halophyticus]|uniref:Acetolactate synthase-1/2/3 large subunit n=1 Tax=Tamaricihabitans halophyticus TaxID=1262583 RepID=A0A4R2QA40_9PSEU|nr:thiamine pyrophosphate-binding protein [Tamaricihabitans halophyticus]TCP45803.1 acetolactate synthase-1/2/3 large subunit [Tamaricihabitans halophyticus]